MWASRLLLMPVRLPAWDRFVLSQDPFLVNREFHSLFASPQEKERRLPGLRGPVKPRSHLKVVLALDFLHEGVVPALVNRRPTPSVFLSWSGLKVLSCLRHNARKTSGLYYRAPGEGLQVVPMEAGKESGGRACAGVVRLGVK